MRPLFTLLLLFLTSTSLGSPRLGPEFTFTDEELYRTQDVVDRARSALLYIDAIEAEIHRRCPNCQILRVKTEHQGRSYLKHIEVHHPHGFEITFTYDNPVIEFNLTGLTKEQLLKEKAQIESLIFEASDVAGLRPHRDYGGGHLHLDLMSSIGSNAKLFRNFIVDFHNHADLFLVMGAGPKNSPVYFHWNANQKKAYHQAIEDIDQLLKRRLFADSSEITQRQLILEIAQIISAQVYNETPSHKSPPQKYQGMNLTRVIDDSIPWNQKTIEFRTFRAQNSVSEFVNLGQLLDGRIKHLRKSESLIENKAEGISLEVADAAQRMRTYAKESGLSFQSIEPAVIIKEVNELLQSAPLCRMLF